MRLNLFKFILNLIFVFYSVFNFLHCLTCEQLLESFQESFPSLEFPPLPERGNLDLNEVLESPYFFN